MAVVQQFDLSLNINKNSSPEKIIVTANDNVEILITLKEGRNNFPLLPEYTYKLVSKPKNKPVTIKEATVKDGKIVAPLNHSETGHQLPIECIIQVFDDDGNRITSTKFDVAVLSDLTTGSNVSPSGSATFAIVDEKEFSKITTKLNENLYETEIQKEEELIISPSFADGFYSYQTGGLGGGSASKWKTTLLPVVPGEVFTLKHPTKATTLRAVFFKDSAVVSHVILLSTAKIKVPTGVNKLAINIPFVGSNPEFPGSVFETVEDINNLTISKTILVPVKVNLVERVQLLEQQPKKVFKILAVGNSFSANTLEYVCRIARETGIELVVGNTYKAGATLEEHYTNRTNTTFYEYQKWSTENISRTIEASKGLVYCLEKEDWDLITFQQASPTSGVYSSFQPHLNNLISFCLSKAKNKDVKTALHMTWSYASNYASAEFETNYQKNQLVMYNAIVDAYKKAMAETGVDILIPTGTAIQNARNVPELVTGSGNEMTADGYHLSSGIPYLITSLVYFEAILNSIFKLNLMNDVKFDYASNDSKYRGYLSKLVVKNAVSNPFKVTQI